MKPFKPFINLIHYPSTNKYELNAIIKIPSDYSIVDLEQVQVDKNWIIILRTRKFNEMFQIEEDFSFKEFSIELTAPDMNNIEKIIMEVKDYEARNGDLQGRTKGDPGDADDGETP
jgi:hypothetical protein